MSRVKPPVELGRPNPSCFNPPPCHQACGRCLRCRPDVVLVRSGPFNGEAYRDAARATRIMMGVEPDAE